MNPGWLLMASLLTPPTAWAGLDVTTRSIDEQGTSSSGRVRTQGDQLRIDLVAPPSGEGASSILFDAQASTMRILRHREKIYLQVDEASTAAISAQLAQARKDLQAQLATLSESQRAMMEKMLEQSPAALAPKPPKEKAAPLEATRTGESDTVSQTPCSVYTVNRGGKSIGDACVASWEALPIDQSEIAVLKKFAAFQRKMAQSFGGVLPDGQDPFEMMDLFDGFPLRAQYVQNGKVVHKALFEKLTQVEPEPSVFAIPADYTRQDLGLAREP